MQTRQSKVFFSEYAPKFCRSLSKRWIGMSFMLSIFDVQTFWVCYFFLLRIHSGLVWQKPRYSERKLIFPYTRIAHVKCIPPEMYTMYTPLLCQCLIDFGNVTIKWTKQTININICDTSVFGQGGFSDFSVDDLDLYAYWIDFEWGGIQKWRHDVISDFECIINFTY